MAKYTKQAPTMMDLPQREPNESEKAYWRRVYFVLSGEDVRVKTDLWLRRWDKKQMEEANERAYFREREVDPRKPRYDDSYDQGRIFPIIEDE